MPVRNLTQWTRLIFGLAAVFALFHGAARALGSDRGQAGLIVGAIVLSATLAVERIAFGQRIGPAIRSLGLGRPQSVGLVAAILICGALLLMIPVYAGITGASVALLPGFVSLHPGPLCPGRHRRGSALSWLPLRPSRRGRTFWQAARLSMLPFVGVHLLLFFTMPWPIALAALLLSVLMSFPLAQLFELGGGTVWPPALLHFVVQGTVKVLVVSGDAAWAFPLAWMAASAVIPMFVLLSAAQVRPPPVGGGRPGHEVELQHQLDHARRADRCW